MRTFETFEDEVESMLVHYRRAHRMTTSSPDLPSLAGRTAEIIEQLVAERDSAQAALERGRQAAQESLSSPDSAVILAALEPEQ